MLDIKITGGLVLDGWGSPPLRADVGVKDDRIESVGELSVAPAKTEISARGCYVCPGFIDAHSHSDTYLLIEPSAPSKIHQGVTTEICGNCGASAAPLSDPARLPSDWQDKKYPGTWRTVAEYRELLGRVGPAVNVALLIGHNRLRAGVMGYEGRVATGDEIARMQSLLEQALEEGGAGLSSGLIYAPGLYAAPEELVALARVAARQGKIYTSHMRSEGTGLLEAIEEALEVGRRSGVRVEISHLKTSGRANWPKLAAALEKIEQARASGLAVAADRYPYTAACTDLDVILPDWATEGGREKVLLRLRDPATRTRIRADLLASREPDYWDSITIGSTHHPEHAGCKGRPLPEVAEHFGVDPVDAVLRLIDRDELRTGGIFFGMSEENLWTILAQPWVMLGSDASLRAVSGPLSEDHPHPRAYGTFPRFLRAALDGKTVSLPEAVRKMTSLPAGHFHLNDRGVAASGKYADLVIFDPVRVRDASTYEKPHQYAVGIRQVLVNGKLTLSDGSLTGARNGRFLG